MVVATAPSDGAPSGSGPAGVAEVERERRALPAGDYAVALDDTIIAAVERKSLADLAKTLTDGSLAFLMAELDGFERAGVVVEDRYSALLKHEHVQPGWLAEEWTYRFLGAALAEAAGEEPLPYAWE